MENQVIVVTPVQLRNLIDESIRDILPKLADFRRKNEPVETDGLSIDDAVRFFANQGIPTTKQNLYNLVFKKEIPYRKVGRRVIFSRKELLQWIESRTYRPHSQSDEALRLAESARKK